MRKADDGHTTSRRFLLAGAVTLPVMALPGPVGDDDAVLIAACQRFVELEHRLNIMIGNEEAQHAGAEPIYDAQHMLLPHVCAPARTFAGMQKKARAIATWAPDLVHPFCETMEGELLASLLFDLTGRAVA